MRILIVDDTESNRILLEAMLRGGGYTNVLSASCAAKAFEKLELDRPASDLADELPKDLPCNGVDLILMDIMMPGINGIEATRTIKNHPHGQFIPVITCTASPEEMHINAAFEAGAADFITWPVTKVELLARVRSALHLKQEIDIRRQREKELLRLAKELSTANERLTMANLMLQRLSAIDPLTGIPNRRGFEATYAKSWTWPFATAEAFPCCLWISTTLKSSTIPAATSRETNACAASPPPCPPAFTARRTAFPVTGARSSSSSCPKPTPKALPILPTESARPWARKTLPTRAWITEEA